MPILSFSSQDIDIITGKKTMTIRKLWKTPLKKRRQALLLLEFSF